LRTDSPAAVPRGRAGGSPISGTRSSHGGNLPETQRKAVDRLFSFIPFENSPVGIWFKAVSQYLSPYDFNPLNINPLKDLIERFVDFEAPDRSPLRFGIDHPPQFYCPVMDDDVDQRRPSQ
jgi:hypothetical protein